MIRRLIRNSRFIYVGVLLKQNDQKKEEPDESLENSKAELQPASSSVGGTVSVKQSPGERSGRRLNGEGHSETYRVVTEEVKRNVTGWDRVKNIFSKSDYYEVNANLLFIINTAEFGVVCGFFLGGFREYTKALNLFMLSNDTSKFMNIHHARSQLARVGLQAFLKGGLLMGPKAGFLIGTFLLIHTMVSEYRGKNGIIEFPIAGAVTTAVMKWNLGIRGMISGICSGGLTGLMLGPIIYLTLKIQGLTVSDTKYMLYSLKKKREEILMERARATTTSSSDLEKFYSEKTKHLPTGLTEEI